MKKLLIAATLLLAGAGCTSTVTTGPTQDNTDYQSAVCVPSCGDGTCQEIVCQGTGCPCAETQTSCPNDCSAPAAADDMSDLIKVTTPTKNAKATSPLTVTGQARGTWYFEASFPIKIYDANNILLGTTTGAAQGDWMTEDFVPFTATLTFTKPSTATGTLVLEKDNPSGLPANDKSISIPVTF